MAFPRNNPRVHKMIEQEGEIERLKERIAALERENAELRAGLADALDPLPQHQVESIAADAIASARADEARVAALKRLAREVELYLDRPGCNVPSRQAAMARLRWALESASTVAKEEAGP